MCLFKLDFFVNTVLQYLHSMSTKVIIKYLTRIQVVYNSLMLVGVSEKTESKISEITFLEHSILLIFLQLMSSRNLVVVSFAN